MTDFELTLLLFVVTALCVALVLVAPRYVLRPLRFRRKFNVRATPDIRPLVPSVRLPTQVGEFFGVTGAPLKSCGFELLGDYALIGFTARTAGTTRLYVNRAKRDMVSVFVIYLRDPVQKWRIKLSVMTFRTDFTDGTALFTSNAATLSFWPKRSYWESHRFIGIEDPAALYRVHEAIIDRFHGSKNKDLLLDSRFNGDWLAFARYENNETPKQMLATGYYWLDATAGVLRLTIKGSFLTIWKRNWPWKQLRERWRDRDAARLLRKLGVDEDGREKAEAGR
jgi:hypothetical protein